MEWGELLPLDEVELLDKEDEMFERGVQVGLLPQLDHLRKVLVVDVGVDSEQPLQDRLGDDDKVLWEWDAYKTKTEGN